MKPRFSFPSRLAVALGVFLFVAGCNVIPPPTPDATRYYVLTTIPPKPATVTFTGPHWRVALRPVEIPSYLRGKAMLVRSGSNEIHYVDEARWAESLEAGLGRVLREGLEGRGEVAHVVASAGEDHDFNITVRLLRCEGDREAKVARFSAVVEIHSAGAGADRQARDTFTVEVPGWDGSYSQLAAKLSEGADGLADRIAALLASEKKM